MKQAREWDKKQNKPLGSLRSPIIDFSQQIKLANEYRALLTYRIAVRMIDFQNSRNIHGAGVSRG